jgi:hypothetical protein
MFVDSVDDLVGKSYIDADTGKETLIRGGKVIDLGTEGKHLKRSQDRKSHQL